MLRSEIRSEQDSLTLKHPTMMLTIRMLKMILTIMIMETEKNPNRTALRFYKTALSPFTMDEVNATDTVAMRPFSSGPDGDHPAPILGL